MPNFLLAYHGGKRPETPAEGEAEMNRWRAWFADMGDSVAEPGNPVGMSKTVSASGTSDDGGSNPISGFSIVTADTIDGAIALANGCPILPHGTIEVAEIMEM